jgi:ribonuclease HI
VTERWVIYTDGACRGNPGPGGWGAVLYRRGGTNELSGAESNTTNNKMELTASIRALEVLKSSDITIDLYTDSKYVIQGINEWIDGWKAKGWKTANKKPVKNVDLWKRLDTLNQEFSVNWHWVKGHSDDPGNDMADLLANQAMDEIS